MELTHLGKQSSKPVDQFDLVPWKHGDIVVNLNATEFTSLCPVTKQPDFATFVISYKPKKHIVETKSFKLFMWRYRDRAAFNEVLVAEIADEFAKQVKPVWVKVVGTFHTRGGVYVEAVAERGK